MNFKIASSNIRFDNPQDGSHDWNGRRGILAQCLNEFAPDLLGTQEGREPQLKDLENNLIKLELVDSHREWIDERMYPCIFVNPETIEVHNSGDIWLSETPYEAGSKSFESAFPRLCTWIIATHKESQEKFFYVNTHLDHVLSQTRKEQIRVLIQECDKVNKENLPVVLTGDFNESPFEDVRKVIHDQWSDLRDCWFTLKKEEETSHHNFNGTREDGTRIDWILTSSNFRVYDLELYKENVDGIYPSDHFPVFGIYSIGH
ncbi:endonuclease/exonuclease/phosphatase family protein [Halobacteriovorax sp. GB3]|uniref:endonuclease/exonuclease/phosphatase family protein n=1 Tax=Halobacteriovorax sp. GB3 TaxID=2719615 RepID=UPI002362B9E0|nr:endonuclease/exonuclease/phosphatase family protein [Halobacteriovorax sp. GB3]MDD0852460.1 endonuclease/exonuclease/phosphatase family protein [Halobacteriovorax sp. GB3]